MGHYLKGKTLEYFAKHMRYCTDAGSGYIYPTLVIGTDSKESASSIGSVVKSTFKGRKYFLDPKDEKRVFVSFNKGDDRWRRTYAIEQINKEVDAYNAANSEYILKEPETDNPKDTDTTDTGEEKSSTNWTTYVILGLAAVAIVVLLFSKKKK